MIVQTRDILIIRYNETPTPLIGMVETYVPMTKVDVYLCHVCLATFLLDQDLQDHNNQTGHKSSQVLKSEIVSFENRVVAFFEAQNMYEDRIR